MNIKELRVASGMSRKQFAEFFGFPYRTLQNWELGLRECPDYLLNLIEYKLMNENLIIENKPQKVKMYEGFFQINNDNSSMRLHNDGTIEIFENGKMTKKIEFDNGNYIEKEITK